MGQESPARLTREYPPCACHAKINTYDIVEITDLGLVYTTTVGMEMAMEWRPVLCVGNTHYREKVLH
jgi:hypothetical protein